MSKRRSCDSLSNEVRHGKNTLGIVSVLEKSGDYDSKKPEWPPKADEMDLVSESHSLTSRNPSLSKVGSDLSCGNHLRTRL